MAYDRHNYTGKRDYKLAYGANWFHSLPHFFTDLDTIDNSFNFDSKEYMTSIACFGAFFGILMIAILVVYLVFAGILLIFLWLRNTPKQKTVDKNEKINSEFGIGRVYMIAFLALVFITLLTMAIDVYNLIRMYDRLATVLVLTNSIIEWFNRVRDAIESINVLRFFNIKQLIQNLVDTISSYKLLPPIVKNITNIADSIVEAMDQIDETIFKPNLPSLGLLRIDVEVYPYYIDLIGYTIAYIVTLMIVLMSAVCLTMIVIGVTIYLDVAYDRISRRTHHLLAFFAFFAIIGFVINTCMCGLGLAGTVFVSDFCIDGKDYLRNQINDTSLWKYLFECLVEEFEINGLLETTESGLTTAQRGYHLVFTGLNKLLHFYCNTTDSLLKSGIKIIDLFVPFVNLTTSNSIACPQSLRDIVANTTARLDSGINSTIETLQTFRSAADCREVNNQLYHIFDILCGDIVAKAIITFVMSVLTFVAFIVLLFGSTYAFFRRSTTGTSVSDTGSDHKTDTQQ